MAIGYTELDFINGTAPALNAANMNHIDEGVKACADALDLETAAGKAMTQAANAAAQRTLLNVEDGADVTDEANVTAAAVGTAEVTAAPAHWWVLAGGALKRMTQAGWTALVLAATGKTNLATGFTVAGGTTPKTLTVSADADTVNVPTANEKTRLSDIQAATGATTALKLANLTSPASTTQQGVALLGASGGAAKLTKMPDGATAVYSQDAWADRDGWSTDMTFSSPSSGIARFTYSSSYTTKTIAGIAGKTMIIRWRNDGLKSSRKVCDFGINVTLATIAASTSWQISMVTIPAFLTASQIGFQLVSAVAGNYIEVDWLWIGDYSYLPGSLSEEAARIADQLCDTAGVGVAASGTITATDVATATKGDTIAGKKYTYVAALTASPGVEGEVLKGATKEDDLENLNLAISEAARTNNGVKYWAAAVHPLVSSTRADAVLTLSAKTAGLLGNQITTICESGTNHTASGSTLSGGKDAVGEKIRTQVENYIAGSGTRPAAAKVELTNTALIGYETTVDVVSGATFTLPAGGTWFWNVYGYGATISSAKRGSSAGGTTLTVAGANASVGYRRTA